MRARSVYLAVAACAVIVYLGALWNEFVWDDQVIVLGNPLVQTWAGLATAFASPYWPPFVGGYLYRPLTLLTYVLDWHIGGAAWFHVVNLSWHAGVSALVAVLARRWAGDAAALVAGMLFAVHPVHVEAVANVVGRAELMAAAFTLLAVYAAVEADRPVWSAVCWALGLLSKEVAVVAPALVVAGWGLLGAGGAGGAGGEGGGGGESLRRPPRRRMVTYAVCWLLAGLVCLTVREVVLHPYARSHDLAAAFQRASPVQVRLTAVAALADVARLLLFPLALRADYSPGERTTVPSPLEWRFGLGLLVLATWAALVALAWRRQRRLEAYGLAWMALAYAPVANFLFPIGVVVAERTQYLPSVGLALAVAGLARNLRGRALGLVVGAMAVAGGARTALRVPVWRSNMSLTLSILEDSPRSYVGPMIMATIYLDQARPAKAFEAATTASSIYPDDPRPYLKAAHAALALGRPALADSLLGRFDALCKGCRGHYAAEAAAARRLGNTAAADSLAAHVRRLQPR